MSHFECYSRRGYKATFYHLIERCKIPVRIQCYIGFTFLICISFWIPKINETTEITDKIAFSTVADVTIPKIIEIVERNISSEKNEEIFNFFRENFIEKKRFAKKDAKVKWHDSQGSTVRID